MSEQRDANGLTAFHRNPNMRQYRKIVSEKHFQANKELEALNARAARNQDILASLGAFMPGAEQAASPESAADRGDRGAAAAAAPPPDAVRDARPCDARPRDAARPDDGVAGVDSDNSPDVRKKMESRVGKTVTITGRARLQQAPKGTTGTIVKYCGFLPQPHNGAKQHVTHRFDIDCGSTTVTNVSHYCFIITEEKDDDDDDVGREDEQLQTKSVLRDESVALSEDAAAMDEGTAELGFEDASTMEAARVSDGTSKKQRGKKKKKEKEKEKQTRESPAPPDPKKRKLSEVRYLDATQTSRFKAHGFETAEEAEWAAKLVAFIKKHGTSLLSTLGHECKRPAGLPKLKAFIASKPTLFSIGDGDCVSLKTP